MAFARIALFPGGTQEHHRAIVEALGEAHVDPAGRLLFAAGPAPEGWQIVQVWDSRERLEAWVQANLGQAFARVGSRGYPAPPIITDFEIDDLLLGTTTPAR